MTLPQGSVALSADLMYEKLWLAAKVIESTMEGIFVTDEEGRMQVINPAFSQITGYGPEEVIGELPTFLRSREHQPTLDKKFWSTVQHLGSWHGELWFQHKDGHSYPSTVSVNALVREGGRPRFVVLFNDISSHKETERELEQITSFDTLTKLPNRAFLIDQLSRNIEEASEGDQLVGILLLDLDRFKIVNDTLGYKTGDLVLERVGRRLKSCLQEDGITIGRPGGDEFLAIIPNLQSVEQISKVAEKIITCLKTPFLLEGQELFLTPSIGISIYPNDGEDSATLLQNAEIALYRAKKHGRNTYQFYTSTFNAKALERLVLENCLRHALERKEFVIHYQPHVDLASGRIVGAEALIRWNQPGIGIISPSEFIPIAEETGILEHIDNWVLSEACRQGKRWQDEGITPLYVAVNLSNKQLHNDLFPEFVATVLETSQLDPQRLEFEMTENIIVENPELTIHNLNKIKQLGVRLAIDDFGTGYSSLSYLKRLPIDVVKIDQSFVRDCIENVDDAAINTAIISMSHSLNMKVIAEGVEHKNQLEFLYSLDCDAVQGYLFSPPLPADQFAELLRKQPYVSQEVLEKQI